MKSNMTWHEWWAEFCRLADAELFDKVGPSFNYMDYWNRDVTPTDALNLEMEIESQ